jgi:hypothetical protein
MAQTSIRADIDKPFNVHRNFFTEIAFDFMIPIDRFAQLDDLIFTEILHAYRPIDPGLAEDMGRCPPSNTKNVGQPHIDAFVSRQIDSRYPRHTSSNLLSNPGWDGQKGQPARPQEWKTRRGTLWGTLRIFSLRENCWGPFSTS